MSESSGTLAVLVVVFEYVPHPWRPMATVEDLGFEIFVTLSQLDYFILQVSPLPGAIL